MARRLGNALEKREVAIVKAMLSRNYVPQDKGGRLGPGKQRLCGMVCEAFACGVVRQIFRERILDRKGVSCSGGRAALKESLIGE